MKRSIVSDIILRYKNEDRIVEKTTRSPKCPHRKRRIPYYQTYKKESSATGKKVNAQTIRRAIHKGSYNGRVVQKKPIFVKETDEKTSVCQIV